MLRRTSRSNLHSIWFLFPFLVKDKSHATLDSLRSLKSSIEGSDKELVGPMVNVRTKYGGLIYFLNSIPKKLFMCAVVQLKAYFYVVDH